MIQKFNNSTLYTGQDFEEMMLRACNQRDSPEKVCACCEHEETEEYCDGCSIPHRDELGGCRCHINPPCSFCENCHFEPAQFLLNHKHYAGNGKSDVKWRWRCFRTTKEVWKKLNTMEKRSIYITSEILKMTDELVFYITDENEMEDLEIEIMDLFDRKKIESMVLNFEIDCE